ncbi:MAG: AAA family ATPase [Anaeroplasma sp.]|nr:AAA family ATPase [Anaeroplasma sp.]
MSIGKNMHDVKKALGLTDTDWTGSENDGNSDTIFDHNVYAIHIKKKNNAVNGGYACIGWSVLKDLSNFNSKEDLYNHYVNVYPGSTKQSVGQCVGILWRFKSDIKVGDYIVYAVPGIIHIGRVSSEYKYDSTADEKRDSDYVNLRDVEWLKTDIDRKKLSTAFNRKLGTAMSLFSINDFKSAVNDLLNDKYVIDEDYSTESIVEPFEFTFTTGFIPNGGYDRNRILFGAPGTGKSHKLNEDAKTLLANGGEMERVTFHTDYSYSSFVGTYKPVPTISTDGKREITYKYVPGPFMRILVKALKNAMTNEVKPYLLLIEEINRAKVSSVFGEVFQLLDRKNNVSEYEVQLSEDMKQFFADNLGGTKEEYDCIKLPDNMFIWASMNSADQGVFPMDTAFKRRWDFTYIGIDENEKEISNKIISVGQNEYKKDVCWNELRKAINDFLSESCGINEDKLMGPFFINKEILDNNSKFLETFKNKVIMYLYEDAARQKRNVLFSNKYGKKYSDICKAFDSYGVSIFNDSISTKF